MLSATELVHLMCQFGFVRHYCWFHCCPSIAKIWWLHLHRYHSMAAVQLFTPSLALSWSLAYLGPSYLGLTILASCQFQYKIISVHFDSCKLYSLIMLDNKLCNVYLKGSNVYICKEFHEYVSNMINRLGRGFFPSSCWVHYLFSPSYFTCH